MDILNLKKLNEIMKAERWNGRSLAIAAGLPTATVWRIVHGKTPPSLEYLMKIAKVLNVKISDLLIEDEPEFKQAA